MPPCAVRLAVRGIEARRRLSADSRPPRAADEEVDVGVHDDLVVRWDLARRVGKGASTRPCNLLSLSCAFAHAVRFRRLTAWAKPRRRPCVPSLAAAGDFAHPTRPLAVAS